MAKDEISKISRDFDSVKAACDTFVYWAKEKLWSLNLEQTEKSLVCRRNLPNEEPNQIV